MADFLRDVIHKEVLRRRSAQSIALMLANSQLELLGELAKIAGDSPDAIEEFVRATKSVEAMRDAIHRLSRDSGPPGGGVCLALIEDIRALALLPLADEHQAQAMARLTQAAGFTTMWDEADRDANREPCGKCGRQPVEGFNRETLRIYGRQECPTEGCPMAIEKDLTDEPGQPA